MSQKILEVTDVELLILESSPEQLMINALGFANTSGWRNPELKPTEKPPTDGIYEFEFVAKPPPGFALQVLTPIRASLTLEEIPQDLKGVKVIASSNEEIQTIASEKPRLLDGTPELQSMRQLERLIGFRMTDDDLIIRVQTGGCTRKEHFQVEVNGGFVGDFFVTIYRAVDRVERVDCWFPVM